MQYALSFPTGTVQYQLDSSLSRLRELAPPQDSIIITDEDVWHLHGHKLSDYRVAVMPAGEVHKSWQTIEDLTRQLIRHEAHRKTTLVGLGGGLVTDVTGFLASIYMRGVPFGFVPSTLLGMVDAAIGGKNGINLDVHKNMLGRIHQPQFILYDLTLLDTLKDEEWSNGFAEIIKYGCIADVRILNTLKSHDISFYKKYPDELSTLIAGCVDVKNKIVHADEDEAGVRKLLNFGHTAGHAFETLYHLKHGHAVALGMLVACRVSEQVCGLPASARSELAMILEKYQLPVHLQFDPARVMEVLRMDKKRNHENIDYVVIEKPGKALTRTLPFGLIEESLQSFLHDAQR